MLTSARLYCILDLGYTSEELVEETTAALLAGGADLLQLRAKGHDLATIRRVAEKLIPLCRAAGVPFILNDHPTLAWEIGADGVHIGQDDGSLADARAAMERRIHSGFHSFIHSSSPEGATGERGTGVSPVAFIHSSSPSPNLSPPSLRIQDQRSTSHDPSSSFSPIHDPQSTIHNRSSSSFLIGRSTHSLAQARAALAEGFDYIGFGPLFPTPTKAGRPAIGTNYVAAMQREVGDRIPAFCIGGIKRSNLADVLQTGARRVVIVSDLLTAPDIQAATRTAATQLKECGRPAHNVHPFIPSPQ